MDVMGFVFGMMGMTIGLMGFMMATNTSAKFAIIEVRLDEDLPQVDL